MKNSSFFGLRLNDEILVWEKWHEVQCRVVVGIGGMGDAVW